MPMESFLNIDQIQTPLEPPEVGFFSILCYWGPYPNIVRWHIVAMDTWTSVVYDVILNVEKKYSMTFDAECGIGTLI